ncbi:MAG: DMT family transporter [Rhodococcus sp. (in: high G+C Gram-positive bacteria)]
MKTHEHAGAVGGDSAMGNLSWLILGGAIVAEVTATLALRAALASPVWYAVVVMGYVAGFTGLTLVLRAGLPVGVAYGIWAASGVALTAISAAIVFGDNMNGTTALGIAVVVCGVMLVNFGSQKKVPDSTRVQQ